jgi:amino acid adenylation domain-containing protein
MRALASYHQERLWFIERFEAGNLYESSPVYHNIPLIFKITGRLDEKSLEISLNEVINRHEALRTGITEKDDKVFQNITDKIDFKLVIDDLSGKSISDQQVMDLGMKYVKEPMPIDGKSLLRANLIRLSNDTRYLFLVVHHIVSDRYSTRIIAEEIVTIYNNHIKTGHIGLPMPDLQFPAISRWQRELNDDIVEALVFFWRRKLAGKVKPLELPTDTNRAAIHVYADNTIKFEIAGILFQKLNVFCKTQAIPKESALRSVFIILLYKYCRQKDIVIGTTALNRRRAGAERVVGPLANLLALNVHLKDTDNFLSVIGTLVKTYEDAVKHVDLPFDKLVAELKPEKDMSRTALFDVLFQYERQPNCSSNMAGICFEIIETNLGMGKYDLNLLMQEQDETVKCTLVYNGLYYKNSIMSGFTRHFMILLENLVKNPNKSLPEINFLAAEEERRILDYATGLIKVDYFDKTIQAIFEEQVLERPEKTAVIFNDFELTYGELNEKANQIANFLRSSGVAPDTIVAILLERSPKMIAAILGILKAGGAYLPVEPDYPEERIEFILKDSDARFLITSGSLGKNFDFKYQKILINSDEIINGDRTNPENINKVTDSAYIIYTSGTTGLPKGAIIEHRNVVRLLTKGKAIFGLNDSDIWTMFHSYCFDFSVWEMYGALLFGGKLVIVPALTAKNPDEFYELLSKREVTVLNQTPEAFYSLSDVICNQNGYALSLRYLIFGGEALKPVRLKQWKKLFPELKLINMFGITETTVHVTYKEITEQEINTNAGNIGRALPSTSVYVMDESMKLVPPGIPGELYVGGDGVCRGYLNREDLTKARFMINPYNQTERIYKSGDLVKVRDDGELVYIGRIDKQIKIRGYRIELGEIEYRLLGIKGIKAAVAVERLDREERYICAYIVGEEKLDIAKIRNELSESIPKYMVPAYFVQLDGIPTNSNGKIDLNVLPAPDIDADNDYLEPASSTENLLAGIWSEVLNLDAKAISVNRNFFEIGGNSLKISFLKNKIGSLFSVDFSIAAFFEYPTIREFSQFLDSLINKEQDECAEIRDFRQSRGRDRLVARRMKIGGSHESA